LKRQWESPTFAALQLDLSMSKTIRIDYFTDIVCPWCLVGSERLDQAIASLPKDVTVEIVTHPFYLDPNTPEEGVVVADMLRQRYGRDPRDLWARVEQEAAKTGIELDLSRQPRAYPTAKPHTLVRLAAEKGTQHALSNALAREYFLAHKQVNDDEVLVEIATRHGFTADEARAALTSDRELAITHQLAMQAAQQGIQGVPFFVFENRFAISGCQPPEIFERALALAQQPPGATS